MESNDFSLACGSWASSKLSRDVDKKSEPVVGSSSSSRSISRGSRGNTCSGIQDVAVSEVNAKKREESASPPNPNPNPHSHLQTKSTSNAKLKLHSRHRSIGHLNELALVTPVVNLVQLSGVNSVYNQESVKEQEKATVVGCEQENESISCRFTNDLEENIEQVRIMSQTMQSIQSLSMQLNRAASMQGYLDEISNMSPHSPLDSACIDKEPSGNFVSSSSNKLSRLVSKKAARVKEMLLQNLGKADKTRDELFQLYEENFYKQQAHALKLQKEFKNYVNNLTGYQEASKSLNNSIQQATGEYQSARHDLVCDNLSQLEHLNEDLMDKLRGQVLISLTEYLTQFNELRDKIAKRRRKLIDYDSSKRVYELMLANVNKKRLLMQQRQTSGNMSTQGTTSGKFFKSAFTLGGHRDDHESDGIQAATSQLMDEARLLKLREQFNYCKIMYETINGELHEELPMIYEKKMKNLLMSLQNYFSLEAQFHSNAGKLFATASDVVDELPMSIRSEQHRRHLIHRSPTSTDNSSSNADALEYNKASSSSGMGSSRAESSHESSSASTSSIDATSGGNGSPTCEDDRCAAEHEQENEEIVDKEQTYSTEIIEEEEKEENVELEEVAMDDTEKQQEEEKFSPEDEPSVEVENSISEANVEDEKKKVNDDELKDPKEESGITKQDQEQEHEQEQEHKHEQIEKVKLDKTDEKSEFLYKVKTNYKYLAEDVDELCFEADEIIQVVKFDEGVEQEEGWLVGIREVNGQRGLFPANFTRPL